MSRQTAIRVAFLSWVVPLAAMAANVILAQSGDAPQGAQSPFEQGQAEGRACVAVLAYIIGAVLAGIALRAVRQHGRAGIRWQAWVGLSLNVILLLAVAGAIILGMSRGR